MEICKGLGYILFWCGVRGEAHTSHQKAEACSIFPYTAITIILTAD